MHEATVTVLSVRKDGKGFKANVPEHGGEIWFSLSDRDKGRIEWKKTYDIAYNIKPGERGNFYNVTRIGKPSLPQEAFLPAPARPAASKSDPGPHVGMWEKRASELLYKGIVDTDIVAHGIKARQLASIIVHAPLTEDSPPSIAPDPDDDIDF